MILTISYTVIISYQVFLSETALHLRCVLKLSKCIYFMIKMYCYLFEYFKKKDFTFWVVLWLYAFISAVFKKFIKEYSAKMVSCYDYFVTHLLKIFLYIEKNIY